MSVRHVCLPAFVRVIAAPRRQGQRSHCSPSPLKLFDHITENEITLKNTGKVGFEFKVLTDHQSSTDSLLPGVPLILPLSVSSLPACEGRVITAGGPKFRSASTPQRHVR